MKFILFIEIKLFCPNVLDITYLPALCFHIKVLGHG